MAVFWPRLCHIWLEARGILAVQVLASQRREEEQVIPKTTIRFLKENIIKVILVTT